MVGMDTIKNGDMITTLSGYELVTGYNGSIVYTDSYIHSEDDPDKLIKDGERMLTLDEIGHLMKEVDGRNHKVWYEED